MSSIPVSQQSEEKEKAIFLLIASSIQFTLLSVYLGVTLYKIKMNVYRPLWVVLICYEVTFFVRLALDVSKVWKGDGEDNKINKTRDYIVTALHILNSTLTRIKWFAILYFVLEANEVYLKLKSTSPEDL